jgi:hypothetical protein
MMSDSSTLTFDFMNASYLSSPLTHAFRSVFAQNGSPFVTGLHATLVRETCARFGLTDCVVHALGDAETNYAGKVPQNQVKVANEFSIWDETYAFIPRHLLLLCMFLCAYSFFLVFAFHEKLNRCLN